MSERPRLIALNGPDDGREYPLDLGEVTLGRDEKHTVPIMWDMSVSRVHARVFQRGGLYLIEDVGSTNGTRLSSPGDEEPAKLVDGPRLLLDKAAVRLGDVACFAVAGVAASMNAAARSLLQRLYALREGLPHLPAEAQERQRKQIEEIECKLLQVDSEEQLLVVAAEGIATVSGEDDLPVRERPPSDPGGDALPPLPKDLPEPGAPDRFESLRNVFVEGWRSIVGQDDKVEGCDERPG